MYKSLSSFAVALFLLLCINGYSQPLGNFVKINSTDSYSKIIAKAANVTPSERQYKWQTLELTGFLHFGVNTFTDKEWGTGKEDPAIFNPAKLDAEQWVKTMHDAGFKQLIITAKHHDGFCLWPTATTKHSVAASPWKNGKGDVVKEVADACKKYGVGFGVYLSPWDMNSEHYGTPHYNDFFVQQLTELLTNYGQVDEVWFDGAKGEGKDQVYDFDRWYALIRKLQPQATIAIMGPDVRWVGTETGVGRTTEWSVIPADPNLLKNVAAESQKDVAFAPVGDKRGEDLGSRKKIVEAEGLMWYPAETDVSIRPGWFYHEAQDSKVKSPVNLMNIYFTSVGRNGVLLLNVPPNKDGLLSDADVKSLLGFKELYNKTFSKNFAENAFFYGDNGRMAAAVYDGKYETYYTTLAKDTTTTININLRDRHTFDLLSVQENILVGQRIEKFVLEYFDNNNNWTKLTEGTTVGFKRILMFPQVTAQYLRFRVLSSRLNPTISEIGLYKLPEVSGEEKFLKEN